MPMASITSHAQASSLRFHIGMELMLGMCMELMMPWMTVGMELMPAWAWPCMGMDLMLAPWLHQLHAHGKH